MLAQATPLTAPAHAPPGCQLWLIDLSQPPDEAAWQACSQAEQARACRFHFERDARRYRAAHAALRNVLADVLGCQPHAVHWHTGPHGKPHLPAEAGLHFNLSHSGDWAVLGLSPHAPIGVDLECHQGQDQIDTLGLSATHFTATEQARLSQVPQARQARHFLQTWCRKEACLKALGSGLTSLPPHFETGWGPGSFDTALPTSQGLCRMQVWQLPLPIDIEAQAAVALLHPADRHLAC